jgi:hypothetical protein
MVRAPATIAASVRLNRDSRSNVTSVWLIIHTLKTLRPVRRAATPLTDQSILRRIIHSHSAIVHSDPTEGKCTEKRLKPQTMPTQCAPYTLVTYT